jgi:hypothetical protein
MSLNELGQREHALPFSGWRMLLARVVFLAGVVAYEGAGGTALVYPRQRETGRRQAGGAGICVVIHAVPLTLDMFARKGGAALSGEP